VLAEGGLAARVVSMPSWELFEAQESEYRKEVLPERIPRLAVEAASSFGWCRYAGATVSLDRFGASSPAGDLRREFGFTPEHVAERARQLTAAER
jgi:transketolase